MVNAANSRSKRKWLVVLVASFIFISGLAAGAGSVLYLLWSKSDLLHRSLPALGLIQKPGEVDIGFLQSMSQHHDQAITMAQIAEQKGSPWVRQFAHGIVLKQLTEIGMIAGWLGVWKAPMLPTDNSMSWLEKGKNPNAPIDALYLQQCRATPGLMPGMFTLEQLNVLRSLQGEEFDRRFLQMMIEHHQGGIPMATFASNNADSYLVKSMARAIAREQALEVTAMSKMMKPLQDK